MRIQELIDRLRAIRDERGPDLWVLIAPFFCQSEVRPAHTVEVLFPETEKPVMVVIR